MEPTALLAYAMTIAVLALKPGPGVLAVVTRTAARGLPGFASYMGGALTGELIFLAFVVFGFSLIGDDILFISIILKALAGVYLIYLGMNTLRDPVTLRPDLDAKVTLKSNWEDYSTGLMLTLSNPLVIVVFAGIVPSVIDTANVRWHDFAILALVTVIVQLAGDLVYSGPVMLSRRFFTPALLNRLRVGSGFVMIAIGLYLGYTALPAQDLLSVLH